MLLRFISTHYHILISTLPYQLLFLHHLIISILLHSLQSLLQQMYVKKREITIRISMPIESSQVMMQSGMLGMGVLFSTSIRGIIINMLILFLFLVLSHVFLLTSSCMVFSCTSTDGGCFEHMTFYF